MDIITSPLKIISNPFGDIRHALKRSDPNFVDFGEAYFSEITQNEVKGWKKHKQMTLNIIVPVGNIRFIVYDENELYHQNSKFKEFIIGRDSYHRLTIPPLVWVAFQGLDKGLNMLLNIASIEHNPFESENCSLDTFKFDWEK